MVQVPSEVRYMCRRGAILMPLKHLSSNCIIITLFYCLTIEQFFDTSTKRSETHVLKGCIKNCSIIKLYHKVLIITWLPQSVKSMSFELFLHSAGSLRQGRFIQKIFHKTLILAFQANGVTLKTELFSDFRALYTANYKKNITCRHVLLSRD